MRKPLIALAALALCVLAACGAQTSAPSNVTATSATYNATARWSDGDGPGHFWYEHSIAGGAFTQVTAPEGFPALECKDGSGQPRPANDCSAPVSRSVSGLPAGTSIRYRFCGYFDSDPAGTQGCYDSAGTRNGTNYTTFSTLAASDCTRTVAAGTSFSSAVSGLGSGDKLCLSAGAYSWGNYSVPAGLTIKDAPAAGFPTITGEASPGTGSTLQDLFLEQQTIHAVVDIKASDVTLQRVDIDGNDANALTQGIIVGSSSTAPNNVRILDSRIHDVANTADTRSHAIYWAGGTNGEIARLWMWDIQAYGLHFYSGNAAGTVAHHTVYDGSKTGRGHVKDSSGGTTTISDSIVTDAGAIRCVSPAVLTLTNNRSQAGYSGCPAGTGNVTADTTYQDEANHDYRVPGDPAFQFVPGPM